MLCMTSAATSGNHERVYGLWVVGQLIAGAVGLFLLPHLFTAFGLRSLYAALAVLGVISTPLIRGFDSRLGAPQRAQARSPATRPVGSLTTALLTICGVLAFYIAIGSVWTFASKAATDAGLDATNTGTVLGIASIMGIAGALLASFVGGRVSRKAMLILGYAILVASLVWLAANPAATGYAVAIFGFKFAWTFVLPFIMAVVAKYDVSGRLVATVNLVIGVGLAIGPLVAGVMLDSGSPLTTIFIGATVVCLASVASLLRVESTSA
jgi:predicted MFS family arabinose efflux permease